MLETFTPTLINVSKNDYLLCGHNIKEFDVPWLCRRFLINGLPLPPVLDIYGKKPWEVNHVDTLELWKFGDYKHFTSLNLLAHVFGIPSPKDSMDGSMVAKTFYEEKDLKKMMLFVHRTFNATDLLYLIAFLKFHYGKFASLEDAFVPLKNQRTIIFSKPNKMVFLWQ